MKKRFKECKSSALLNSWYYFIQLLKAQTTRQIQIWILLARYSSLPTCEKNRINRYSNIPRNKDRERLNGEN